jgi:hypothetical protein
MLVSDKAVFVILSTPFVWLHLLAVPSLHRPRQSSGTSNVQRLLFTTVLGDDCAIGLLLLSREVGLLLLAGEKQVENTCQSTFES